MKQKHLWHDRTSCGSHHHSLLASLSHSHNLGPSEKSQLLCILHLGTVKPFTSLRILSNSNCNFPFFLFIIFELSEFPVNFLACRVLRSSSRLKAMCPSVSCRRKMASCSQRLNFACEQWTFATCRIVTRRLHRGHGSRERLESPSVIRNRAARGFVTLSGASSRHRSQETTVSSIRNDVCLIETFQDCPIHWIHQAFLGSLGSAMHSRATPWQRDHQQQQNQMKQEMKTRNEKINENKKCLIQMDSTKISFLLSIYGMDCSGHGIDSARDWDMWRSLLVRGEVPCWHSGGVVVCRQGGAYEATKQKGPPLERVESWNSNGEQHLISQR